jgi:hypothetical protein
MVCPSSDWGKADDVRLSVLMGGGRLKTSRASTRATCTGCHSPRLLAVGIPRRFNSAAVYGPEGQSQGYRIRT